MLIRFFKKLWNGEAIRSRDGFRERPTKPAEVWVVQPGYTSKWSDPLTIGGTLKLNVDNDLLSDLSRAIEGVAVSGTLHPKYAVVSKANADIMGITYPSDVAREVDGAIEINLNGYVGN